jgi:hypothetical protein
MLRLTAAQIERANRILRDPFDSNEVSLFTYGKPAASDDGLFKHRTEYVPCFGCQPDPSSGDATWRHAHLVIEGANGGVRCEPLRITEIAQDYLSHGSADVLELLAESGLLCPDDGED